VKVRCFKPPGKKYSETEVMPRGKASALSTNVTQNKQWLSSIPDVSKMFDQKSYDELSKIINDWIDGGMPDGNSEGTSRGPAEKTSTVTENDDEVPVQKKTTSSGNKNYKSLDDAFSDLIED
jgi:hypothetical protein